jgi:hypothetical protein
LKEDEAEEMTQYVLSINKEETYNRIGNLTAIASYITAQARCRLFNAIEVALGDNGILGKDIFYCDTDSIICTELAYRNLVDAGLIHPTQLGKLKNEIANGD